ncbi:MAG: MarR family transcriptional regulator [Acidobacteria bacterium]|nr:MarR family transcriptional regulator [Acidobacteriota bacterium]
MNERLRRTARGRPSRMGDQMICSLFQAASAVERRLEEALERVGLSVPKYGALSKLVQAVEPLSLSELASQLTCVRSNITQLVDRLEAEGLVRRVKDPADRRSKRAAITTLGRERQSAGARQVAKVQRAVARTLSSTDRARIVRALSALR